MTLSLKQILIKRDNLTPAEAEELIQEARERVHEGEDPENILHNEFGLEPDYIFALLD